MLHCRADQYRLCPRSAELTEECFQRNPMHFAGSVALEWQNGTRTEIQGRFLNVGTTPNGSTWARNPLPYSNSHVPPQFEPPCNEDPEAWRTESGLCSGRFPVNVSLVDWLTVPHGAEPGEWVLQLRYDCEGTCCLSAVVEIACIVPPFF